MIAPYILMMVTTPMLAFVPFLRLKLGFGLWPIVIAVALASGPMVMINAATGFRRTDLAKIALARSYGASTFQIFAKIRFPLALPMIIVGFMVGSIFGLLTAVGGEMVAASEDGGLGERLVYFSSLARMHEFGATILIIAALGVVDLRHLLLRREALGELGGVGIGPKEGTMAHDNVDEVLAESTLTRRDAAEASAQGAAAISLGGLLTAGPAFGRGGAQVVTIRWISPRGTLEVMDDYNLWVPIKMGYFKALGINVKLIARPAGRRARVGEVRRPEPGRRRLPLARRPHRGDRRRRRGEVGLGHDLGPGLQFRAAA